MSAVESLGKYEIRRQLGRGAMGTVYEGFDPIIQRIVAIKTVRLPEEADEETAEQIARFRREAQAAGRLNHPNIVGVFDYGETADLAYIVMEFVDGAPLKALLDKNERFPLPRIVQIMDDLLAGLQYSHARGVVHRDIKPANLMLTESGQAKIADFGIARIESSSMTQAGTVLGTPAYMSPEQFMGLVVDARTDIYSSGVLLYQLLTGERPYEGSMSAIMHKALNTDAPLPSQISVTAPRPFDEVVRKAMQKRPEDRYASATEFAAAIRAAAQAPPPVVVEPPPDDEATMVTARQPTRPRAGEDLSMMATTIGRVPAPARSSSRPMMIGGGIAGLAVLGGIGYFLLSGNPTPPEPARPPGIATPSAGTTPPAEANAKASAPEATPPGTSAPSVVASAPATEPAQPTKTSPPVVQAPAAVTPTTPPLSSAAPVVPPAVTQPAPVLPPVALAPPPNPAQTPLTTPTAPAVDPAVAIRAQLATFIYRLPCSMMDGDVRDRAVRITGIGGRAAVDSLRQQLLTMALTSPPPAVRVTQVDPVFCPWQDLLRPFARGFGDSSPELGLRLPGDPAFLVKDQFIRPRLAMADFRGELRVDYLDRGGNVQHLYPQLADPKERLAADPPRVFDPGETLALGETGPENRGWQVDEPYGTDLIIAIASEDALFERPRPGNVERAASYLRDLKRALEAARSRGARLAAAAMPVETRPQ